MSEVNMRRVKVGLGDRSYEISIGRDLLVEQAGLLPEGSEVAVVTDDSVMALDWFKGLEGELRKRAKVFRVLRVGKGEEAKCLEVFSRLCSELAEAGFSRGCQIVAVGGGVVGDLAGYLAASYLRGVSFIQVPTTLLAMVDSSVGGKTGVNLPEGKNLVGAFYQPKAVWVDLGVLETLPKREFSAGMAEVVKYGVIRDRELFDRVKGGVRCGEGNGEFTQEALGGWDEEVGWMIERCVKIKADVVATDEREVSGVRALLNFGHTVGHAIEQSCGYGKWLHGEAISVGMMAAAWMSHEELGFSVGEVNELREALEANGLPVEMDGLDYDELLPVMLRDKKKDGGGIKWVLASRIGEARSGILLEDGISRRGVKNVCGE